jgi:hypothetical protein
MARKIPPLLSDPGDLKNNKDLGPGSIPGSPRPPIRRRQTTKATVPFPEDFSGWPRLVEEQEFLEMSWKLPDAEKVD